MAQFHGLGPFQKGAPRIYASGTILNLEFVLKSIANHGKPVTDAQSGLSVVLIDQNGVPTSKVVFSNPTAFKSLGNGEYAYSLSLKNYVPGIYTLTIFGNAFPAQSVNITVVPPK